MFEDKELRLKERDEKSRRDDNRDTDWYQNVRNVAELGEQLGYTEKHHKNVLSRFISWFNPELTIVTSSNGKSSIVEERLHSFFFAF